MGLYTNSKTLWELIGRKADMGHASLYGKIVFNTVPTEEQLLDLAFYITQKAVDYRFGINLYSNLSDHIIPNRFSFDSIWNCVNEKYIPYEILDNPLTNECRYMFRDVVLDCEGLNVLPNYSNTRIPALQDFLGEILNHKLITKLTLRFEDEHGHDNITVYEYSIKPHELCEVLEQVPNDENGLEIPAAKFVITK